MYLTFTFGVSDAKNDDGQGSARCENAKKSRKGREIVGGLSFRKKAILSSVAQAFSEAYLRLVAWGMANWSQIPFTFPLTKDDQPILDKNGSQKFGLTSAHYLANWLSSRVSLSDLDLHSRLSNGARNQAAETLLSQFRLRQTEETQPGRLTGEVGEVQSREFDRGKIALSFGSAINELADHKTSSKRLAEISKTIYSGLEPRFLPVLFSGPSDFLLFKHSENGRIFVCLPLLSRGSGKIGYLPGVTARNGQPFRKESKLVPLRDGEDISVPSSGQWFILPLEHQRRLPKQRNAEDMIADPVVLPRTAELRFKNGSWCFNIVVEVPEPEPFKPEAFLGIHFGYYSLSWSLVGTDGQIQKEGLIDQTHLKNLVVSQAKQRAYARTRMKSSRFPKYRGVLKLEREKALKQILNLARESRAAIGIENISGLDKSTWVGEVNLLRSHWDFGKDADVLTYKSVLAGLPVVGRGRKRQLFQVSSFRANFTCSSCWYTNAGKQVNEQLVSLEDGQIFCGNCSQKRDRNWNAARVVAVETRKFFQKRK